jgi:hypothetical protein
MADEKSLIGMRFTVPEDKSIYVANVLRFNGTFVVVSEEVGAKDYSGYWCCPQSMPGVQIYVAAGFVHQLLSQANVK